MKWSNYYRLARFDKPIGIVLLWVPIGWALWIANQGRPSLQLTGLFFLGTVFMRSAGCIFNDIVDRDIDLHVKRTKNRPLTSNKITVKEASILLIGFLFASLLILLQLPFECFYYALVALAVTFIYPFCKRFIQGPQLVLGIAFSLGIPMVYAAANLPLNFAGYYLLLINYAWIIAYDTQYAMVDRLDDLKIGVKSTAILFAHHERLIISLLHGFLHTSWLILAYLLSLSAGFYISWIIGAFILFYQHQLIVDCDENHCLQAFNLNSWYGLIMWLGLVLSYL